MPPRRSLPQRVSDSFRVIKELDLSHRYEERAGTIVLVLLAAAVLLVAVTSGWLAGSRRPVRVVVEFPTAGGLSGGDPVVLAGVPVGRVRRVQLVETGRVRVMMHVDRDQRPRRDAVFEAAAVNLLGDVVVNYRAGTDSVFAPEDTILAGRAPRDFGSRALDVKRSAEELAVSARAFLRRDFKADLAAAREATDRARRSLDGAQGPALAALTDALKEGQAVLATLDSLVSEAPVDSIRAGLSRLGESAGLLMGGVAETQERLTAIRSRMDSGQGNIGLATRDDALRRELDATRGALDNLLAKYLGRKPAGGPTDRRTGGDSAR